MPHFRAKPPSVLLVVATAAAMVASVAKGGHEMPVYPSYYPHEIAIRSMPPERAAELLRENKIEAYVGAEPRFAGELPASMRTVESLGGFVTVRINPSSPLAGDRASECAAVAAIVADIAGKEGVVFHPYPVTPFDGDYLYHADRAEAAKARFLETRNASPPPGLKIKAEGAAAHLVRPEWRASGTDWDAAVEMVDAASLVVSPMISINGWLGPAWVKTGWFHADRLLADAIDDAETRHRIDAVLQRLETSGYRDMVERVNLERELVAALTAGCREAVAGYTVRREYFSAEFTTGIENVGFDSIAGLNSPMFIRTVKLKDFPWNGWLTLGIDGQPDAAWNPIAGFDDSFGRLLWSAIGDPALLSAPYDSGWTLNRISDVRWGPGR